MEIIGSIFSVIAVALQVLFLVGMIKPRLILSEKLKIKRPRLCIFLIIAPIYFVVVGIGRNYWSNNVSQKEDSQLIESTQKELSMSVGVDVLDSIGLKYNSLIEEAAASDSIQRIKKYDTIMTLFWCEMFDTLYNRLQGINPLEEVPSSRNCWVFAHKTMQNFLFKHWWRMIEGDSAMQYFPLTYKEFEKCCKKYDKQLVVICKEDFDSLYNKLMEIDHGNIEDPYRQRKSLHKKIQNYLYNEWWPLMESFVLDRSLLPITYKEYVKSNKKYGKQQERFALYGDEDIYWVKFWAKSDAETILRKLMTDPESLVLEDVICNGKARNGWKCTIVYRGKNGFGGYVREYITLIMGYDEERERYRCVDVL